MRMMELVDRSVERAVAGLDMEQTLLAYKDQNQFVFLEEFLPEDALSLITREVRQMEPDVVWNWLPMVRRAGAIGYARIQQKAPAIAALYKSPAFLAFVSRLAGQRLFLKDDADEHSCALYYYRRRGDHVAMHFDTCGCEVGASYTILMGVVDRSSSRLVAELYKGVPGQKTRRLELATPPGSMAFFNGSRVYHGVTPLGKDEERVVLAFAYTSEPAMARPVRLKENLKDALIYFGLPGVFQKNYAYGRQRRASLEGSEPLRVVITGASSGIGAAIALQYARRGADLALFARRNEKLAAVAGACLDAGATGARVIAGDTTSREDVKAAVDELRGAWPRIDRAYLNAGGYGEKDGSSLQTWSSTFSADRIERVMRTNYLGVVYWMDALLPAMREARRGTIAVTGAMAADRGLPGSGPYAASKAALRALLDGLRADARRDGIRLCLIEPGFVVSELTEADCCMRMPFLQPTDRAAERFVEGVEAGERVIRFPWQWSVVSRLGAEVPRVMYDLWAERLLPKR